jgi:hypothetical protein
MIRNIFLVLFLVTNLSIAHAGWTPEEMIPEMSYVGQSSPQEVALGQELRQHLIHELQYWKNNGMPQPAPLEGIYYITSTDHIKIDDFLHTLNPTISDVRAHVVAQHEALMNSNLFSLLKSLQEKYGAKIKNINLSETLFDWYAQIRYGYSVKDFYQAVMKNDFLGNVDKGLESHAHKDNAFFGEFPRIELTDVLPGVTQAGTGPSMDVNSALGNLGSLINIDALNKEAKTGKSRKIIILPRSTQQEGDAQISTLNDRSVLEHEAGHWFIHGLIGDRPIDTMLDEAGADYMYASSEDDPKIGVFFSQASAVIAERLKHSQDPDDVHFADAMEKMAEKGYLRDLSEVSSIDSLDRSYKASEAHDAGNPVRSFIWQLRSQDKLGQVDQLMVSSLKDFSTLPSVISSRSNLVIGFRQVMMQINTVLRMALQEKKLENQGKTQEDVEHDAKKIVTELIDQKEDAARAKRLNDSWFGFTSQRPAIKADYVIPEFFRTFYRNAQKQAPQLLPLIRSLAEKAMHSESVIVKTKSGVDEIVFVRSNLSKLNPVAMVRVNQLVNQLSDLRGQIESGDGESPDSKKLLGLYENQLEKVQEYERTGASRRLFFPHPVLGAGAKAIGLLTRKSDSKKSEELPKGLFTQCREKIKNLWNRNGV